MQAVRQIAVVAQVTNHISRSRSIAKDDEDLHSIIGPSFLDLQLVHFMVIHIHKGNEAYALNVISWSII